MMLRVCVFCGSAKGADPSYAAVADRLGEAIAERGWGLVFGGGHIGLMGVIADAALRTGGEVIGVIPRQLRDKELAHPHATQMHVVDSMHERKALMASLSDAFVALPGGFGTADELFEILTWRQLGIHNKPIALLNHRNYFGAMLEWIDTMLAEGFLKAKYRGLWTVAEAPEDLLERIAHQLYMS